MDHNHKTDCSWNRHNWGNIQTDRFDQHLIFNCHFPLTAVKNANKLHVARQSVDQSVSVGEDTKGAFHQSRSSLNQDQIWTWPRFSRNFCCTNAVQIKSRVKLGLTMNRRWRRIKLWSSVQLALCSSTTHLEWSLPSLSRLQTSWDRVQV